MKTLTTGLLGCLLLTSVVQADVFVSVDAKGSYVLSNVHRPGRTYERVIHEPQSSLVGLDQQPQMIARQPYAELVSAAATANELPAALLHAVIREESRYNSDATSPKGAGGLMQLMPDTAREMGVKNVYDPKANIQGGAKYLKRLLTLFDNDITLAVAAYNAGPQAVLSRGGVVPPFAETQRYVPSVLRQYRRLQGLAMDAPL
ncbi:MULTISPECIES: lytic transglycosylase domain-containing protein [Pseudomonas]|jgi:soluble lytic murein transglycosylase-like protein|uniref:Lytic transglycosylase domain-containing protein n=3 Tax=Pseudomonas fluorescens group TaxID=136843 RepID=A0AB36CU66_9PSED|nr:MULTISPECIES: lytic transglycosylase domain-containing protein [Pseudomonas]MBU0526542.1 lytic transglycosylase domain-containing protein [Gammaproteobacteria bacterium]MDF9880237.1 soluble lytic murein transglycosylase-like protein [Pseudomonas silensiensis]AHZ72868.1 lytic transglycosylase, catalytic [Pseudomonas mandelii JR-1]MBA4359530.1 lytic transglycosylase domain-containing protein [Pseudomonas sp.]MBU0819361.1 lytic transglycosylase domain-containing protein [Gammaproteobacteria ba